jgi:hypothetical protein
LPAYNYLLSGSITVQPASGFPSGDPFVNISLNEPIVFDAEQLDMIALSDNTPKVVSFGDLSTGANVVYIYAMGAKVKATITSADGAAQNIPVDPLLILESSSVPVTAITLTRDPAAVSVVYVKILLGHKA